MPTASMRAWTSQVMCTVKSVEGAPNEVPSLDRLVGDVETATLRSGMGPIIARLGEIVAVAPSHPDCPPEFKAPRYWDGMYRYWEAEGRGRIYLNGQTYNLQLLMHELGHHVDYVLREVIPETWKEAFQPSQAEPPAFLRDFWAYAARKGGF